MENSNATFWIIFKQCVLCFRCHEMENSHVDLSRGRGCSLAISSLSTKFLMNSLLSYSFVFLVILVPGFLGQDNSAHNHGSSADANTIPHHNINPYGCDCMEYWTCALSGGSMYSYCGIHAHDVCCFVPENAEPVGILPNPSRSRCGKKGFDSGHEGEADMAEWPWHVSQSFNFT